MSCPLNKNRWKGSGYVKESNQATEADKRLAEMLEARNRMEVQLTTPQPTPQIAQQPKLQTIKPQPICRVCDCTHFSQSRMYTTICVCGHGSAIHSSG